METGDDVPAIPARLGCLLNWQVANLPIAESEPRKLFTPVAIEIEACLVRHSSYEGTSGVAPDPQHQGGSVHIAGARRPQAEHPTEPPAWTRPSPDVPPKHVNENRLPTTKRRASSTPMFPPNAGTTAQNPRPL
jgi:hypothetical protein